MKLKEYIEKLKEIYYLHPNLDVVYATDDEGNNFAKVHFDPSYGHFDGHNFGNDTDEQGRRKKVNAVCIN